MSLTEIASELDAITGRIIALSAKVAAQRSEVEAEYQATDDPDMKPLPIISENDSEFYSITVELPDSDMSLSAARKWLGEVQSALVVADKKFRSLVGAQK